MPCLKVWVGDCHCSWCKQTAIPSRQLALLGCHSPWITCELQAEGWKEPKEFLLYLLKNKKKEKKPWTTVFLKSHLNLSCLSKALLPVNRSWVFSFNSILLVRMTTKLSAARKRKGEKTSTSQNHLSFSFMKYIDKYSSVSTLLVLSCLRAMASFQTKPAKPILRSNPQIFMQKHRNEMGVVTKGGGWWLAYVCLPTQLLCQTLLWKPFESWFPGMQLCLCLPVHHHGCMPSYVWPFQKCVDMFRNKLCNVKITYWVGNKQMSPKRQVL